MKNHRRILLAALAAAVLHAPLAAHAQSDWPAKPVTMILPYPPGGLGDTVARRLSARLSEMWKVPVTVDSRPGAGGLLGAGLVAKAPADGQTLLFTIPETLSITKAAKSPQEFDPVDDFQPLALVTLSSTVLAVPAGSPHRSFAEFMDFARKNPGKVNFGIQGTGSGFHLALEQLKAMGGVSITAIPYKGAAPTMVDLLAGRIDGIIVSTSVTIPHVQSGKLRVIAVASKDRVPQMPGVPTISESGLKGYDAPVGLAVFARAGTPAAIVSRASTDIRRVMHEPPMLEYLSSVAATTTDLTPAEFRECIQREVKTFAQLIEKAGIKLE